MADFEHLVDILGGMATAMDGLGDSIAPKLAELVEQEFANESDPYGSPWARLAPTTVAKRGSSNPILEDSGKLHGSVAVRSTGDAVEILMDDVASFHQYGTVNMPARPLVPGDELPESWEAVIEEEIAKRLNVR